MTNIYVISIRKEKKKHIGLKISNVKPLSASWIVVASNYMKNKPEIIINDFKEAGMSSCI